MSDTPIQNTDVAATNTVNNKSSFTSIVEDHTGGISATRVLMLAWGIGVLSVWGFATVMSVLHGVYAGIPIPESVVTILLGVVGGKVVQRPFEK